MKVLAVLGSPRSQGNSATLAREVLAGLEAAGAEVRVYELNRLEFQGCQGCGACKAEAEACVLEDGFTPIYAALRETDVLLLASPVYFGDLSGQMKCFFDRLYALANPDFTSRLSPGKRAVVILTQGAPPEEMFADIFPRYERWLKHFGFGPIYLLRGLGLSEAGEAGRRPELMAQAREIAACLTAPA
jgi:multimeric flavodoxin WrbA